MSAARLGQGAAPAGRDGADVLFGLPDASWVTPAVGADSVFQCLGPLQGHGGVQLDGSMGKVFRGTWRGKPVAAKIHCAFASADEGADSYFLRSDRVAVEGVLREVMRELTALTTLRHSNVISLVGVAWGTYSGVPVPKFLCMELASLSLKDAMTGATWGLVDARRRLCEVAHGLKYLHQRKFVHRDIKPANIVLLDGFAKVADLGLAKRTNAEPTTSGTLLYLAKIEEAEQASPSRDVFAFGITFAEAVVKRSLESISDRDAWVLEASTAFSVGADLLRRCTDLNEHRRPLMADVREECEHINAIMDEMLADSSPVRDQPAASRPASTRPIPQAAASPTRERPASARPQGDVCPYGHPLVRFVCMNLKYCNWCRKATFQDQVEGCKVCGYQLCSSCKAPPRPALAAATPSKLPAYKLAICSVPGCDRPSRNGMPGEKCHRGCRLPPAVWGAAANGLPGTGAPPWSRT